MIEYLGGGGAGGGGGGLDGGGAGGYGHLLSENPLVGEVLPINCMLVLVLILLLSVLVVLVLLLTHPPSIGGDGVDSSISGPDIITVNVYQRWGRWWW